jgi:hypothetical protein
MHALEVAEDFFAQVEHDHLPGPLHEIGLQVFEEETEEQESDVEQSDLRDTDQRFGAEGLAGGFLGQIACSVFL